MTINADVQALEPGAEVILLELDGTSIGGSLLRFHGYCQVGTITWQTNIYSPWPLQLEGFEKTSDQQPVPKLSVGNIDGSISSLCLSYQDLVGAKVTVHRTFGKYLDAVNFGGVNPTADPTQEIPPEIWFIERKASEDNEVVQFELSNALNFGGVMLPRRQIIANVCGWQYRSAECGYAGGPVAKSDDTATSNPALDDCSLRVSGCKLRFGAAGELPFGSFPAAAITRT